MRKLITWSLNKRGLSPIFATLILATIIIVFGTVAYYYSSNLTSSATNSYTNSMSTSAQSISERIGFENVLYNSSTGTLTIYIINCGSANNVQINSIFIYDNNHNIVGQPFSGNQISPFQPIDRSTPTPTPITGNRLNVGEEGYFAVSINSLSSGSIYTIQLITNNGSNFNYAFYA
jgi:hypothetical protein